MSKKCDLEKNSGVSGIDENDNELKCIEFNRIKGGKPFDYKQAWYADDSSSAGELEEMRKWWDVLNVSGPKYGYFPLAKKTILIVKPEHLEKANIIL